MEDGKKNPRLSLHYLFVQICWGIGVPVFACVLPLFNLNLLIPITVDSKPTWNTLSLVPSNPLLNNVLLMTIFIVQHSILKKPINKLILQFFRPGAERSFYSLISGLVGYMVFIFWLPMTEYKLWDIQTWWLYYGVMGCSFLSHFICMYITFRVTSKILDLNLYGDSATDPSSNKCPVKERPSKVYKDGIYSYMRHPQLAFMMYTFCISPTMTAGHALWSGGMAVYIVSAVTVYEEPALIEEFGDEYKQYMKEVPGFIPDFKKLFWSL